jgi:hypothetical protein
MAYFDPAKREDLHLLHASVREHDELETVAAAAERDVLAKAGFDDEQVGNVAEALRLTIADVVSHRLRYYNTDDTVTSVKRGERSKQRAVSDLDTGWPDGWAWRLRKIDDTTVYFS